MALSSTTGVVDGTDVTYSVVDNLGQSRGNGIIAYVQYTLGAGDSEIKLTHSYIDNLIDDNYYSDIYVSSQQLVVNTIKFSATGKYRIPLQIAKNEEGVKVSFSGLVDGSLNIEFNVDQPYR